MKNNILSAKKFNEMQTNNYIEYCKKCENNNIIPAKKERYFPSVVNYGYVYMNNFREIYWRKNKKALLNFLGIKRNSF
ncbi:MAG: hypothetical protein PHN56_04020 [Candidatus Nanoarchaeia archaeon]|nr:hypothetical protein [Candidatus Nanoarchaeia archaeon]